MNWLDGIILVVLIFLTLHGLWKGFIRLVLPLAGLLVGVALAGRYCSSIAYLLFPSSPSWGNIGGFILILALVLILSYVLASAINRLLSWLMLTWLDKVVGGVLGLSVGIAIWGFLLSFLAQLPFLEAIIGESMVATFVKETLPFILPLLPEGWQSLFKSAWL